MPLRLKSPSRRATDTPHTAAIVQASRAIAAALYACKTDRRNDLFASIRELIGVELMLLALKERNATPEPKTRTH